ncbi:MAG: NFACT family protein, partial [Armatimonadetes bacterium]|nr:NFACT family protein [Armatimonadota bacterium]
MKPQLPDSLCVSRLVAELDRTLTGGRVCRVFAPGPDKAVLEVGVEGGVVGLLLCWRPGLPRIHLVAEAEPTRERVPFVETLRRRLEGAIIARVTQQAFDRVIEMGFINLENLGPSARGRLIVELTGRQANCLLLDSDELIIAVARPTPDRDDLYRVLAPGRPYRPPPGQDKMHPRSVDPETLAGAAALEPEKTISELLSSRLQGISPLLAGELERRTGLSLGAPLRQLEDNWTERLCAALAEVFAEADKGEAWLHLASDKSPVVAYPLILQHLLDQGAVAVASPSLSEAVASVADAAEIRQKADTLRGQIVRALRHDLEHKQHLLELREAELREAQQADKWRRWGELLMANLHVLRDVNPGSLVEVVDFYSADQRTITIPLLPSKGARET